MHSVASSACSLFMAAKGVLQICNIRRVDVWPEKSRAASVT